MKLTAPQLALLRQVAVRDEPCASSYEPARRIVAMGYAVWKDALLRDVLAITDAGRRALKEYPHDH